MNRVRLAGVAMIGVILVVATGCPPLIPFGDPAAPPPTVARLLAVGSHHTCAQNGRIFCWGDNSSGQLGDGITTSSTTPVQVPGVTWASDLSAGGDRTCAIAGVDSNVWCWGDNSSGGLGDGTTTDRSSPTKVVGLIDMRTVSVGDTFTCAARDAGGVVCWGQVPGVAGGFTTTPVSIAGLETASDVTVGANHACALIGFALDCFGDNSDGQLGDGTTTSSTAPVEVAALSHLMDPVKHIPIGVVSFAAAGDHTCAASASLTTYWCWGDNSSGQLGDDTTTNNSTPQAVPFPALGSVVGASVPHVALGDAFSCIEFDGALDLTGTAYTTSVFGCWGDNSSGQLGDGSNTSRTTYQTNPTDIFAGQLAAGGAHACEFGGVVTAYPPNPPLRCWGDNGSGQLGNGTTTSSNSAVAVPGAYSKDAPAVKPANPLPKVTFTATPKIAVAGQPETFTVHITHPVGLISDDTSISTVDGRLSDSFGCGDDNAVVTGTDTDRTITISCTMPIDAPVRVVDNGTSLYGFNVSVRAIDSPRYAANFPFYLKGTNTDFSEPTRVSAIATPDTVAPGDSIVLTAQVSEPHGPISLDPITFNSTVYGWSCGPATFDGSAAPTWNLTVSCVVGSAPTSGTTAGLYSEVRNAFGSETFEYWSVNVTSP